MSFPPACFVTGTDTGAGKTLVACALLHALAGAGNQVAGIKPVAAGAEMIGGRETNADVHALGVASNLPGLDDRGINPVLLRAALSPHLAAQREGRTLRAAAIVAAVRERISGPADHYIVEGAGGWLAPINETETMADLATGLGLPVLLVVGLRLGCLNHALLTAQAVQAAGLHLFGWVGTPVAPGMEALEENHATLVARLPGRPLGRLPWSDSPDPAAMAPYLALDG